MPDQSSAATEHAILQEITAPLEALPDDPLPIASDVEFPIALRGYDRLAVDAYVKKTSQLVAELQATRSPDAAIRRALERVGEQISGILQRSHETAEQITSQSRSEAEDRLEAARQEAIRITAEAHNRLQELDAETDRIWAERHRIVEDARALARQLLALAESAADRFPADEDSDAQIESGSADAEESPGEAGRPGPEGGLEPESRERESQMSIPPPSAQESHDHLEQPPVAEEDWGEDTTDGEATAVMPPVRPNENHDPLQ